MARIAETSIELLYTKGAQVWIPDSTKVWKSAEIVQDFTPKSPLIIQDEDGHEIAIPIKNPSVDLPHLRNPQILIGLNDLTSLSYLHEPAVLYNLNYRFTNHNAIYTYCGIVLVAINPYEELPIYSTETIWAYRGQGNLDPHIFAVAEDAYTKMERDGRDQSIIVSGESGAGKTVSAKYAMRYVATVGGSENETQIERKVLASNPIMEAIGNAKTTRNDNSSRFGKYVELHFNSKFSIIGASMRTYLLEKSRVVFQSDGERNYHIFYQMCAARNTSSELSKLFLDDYQKFQYTRQPKGGKIDGVNDADTFLETLEALKLLGFDEENRRNFFKLLSALLHLGNVKIHGDTESSYISKDDEHLEIFSQLLGVDFDSLRKWLCHRKIVVGAEELIKVMCKSESLFCRDALSKLLYAEAFNWIVDGINRSLETVGKFNRFIGVLDIYGFEKFQQNSFEQFCINYANEKLQQQFNLHVFKLEQEEYTKEGIEVSFISYYDNQPCIQLIEAKLGILDLLDEECRMPNGSDGTWVLKLYSKCGKWEQFVKPKMGNSTTFIILHFADKVEYQSNGFLEKNRDTVIVEQISTVSQSQNDWIGNLMKPVIKAASSTITVGMMKTKKTVGNQFRDSLSLLMTSLNKTTPHYIRCIKPNDSKKSFVFDPHRAVQQLRACGVLETVRISAAGFPSRWTYSDFYGRYRVLCPFKEIRRGDHRRTCERIMKTIFKDEEGYRFGKTKLFFRAGQVAFMEKMRHEKLTRCGITIQKHVRRWLCQKHYEAIKKTARGLQRFGRGMIARRETKGIKSRLDHLNKMKMSSQQIEREKIEKEESYKNMIEKCQEMESKLKVHEESMGLILILQQRLADKEYQNKMLEKLLDKRENESPMSDTRRTQDIIRLQELEMENSKLRDDLISLRDSIENHGNDQGLTRDELNAQFCRMQSELSRRLEETIQLKTVLASLRRPNASLSPFPLNGDADEDDDYIGMIVQTQKQIHLQLEKELHEERILRSNLEIDLNKKIAKLKAENDHHQDLLANNLNSITSKNETLLLHQVQRVTTENLDLRENVDKFQRQIKLLERQLKATRYGNYLGMLEYTDGDESKIMQTLIWNLEPLIGARYLPPCLAAYIIFMLVRYTDHLNDENKVQVLLNEAITMIRELMRDKGKTNLDLSTFWLSNILRLLHTLKQYSDNVNFQMENTREQSEHIIKNFDLSEYFEVIEDMAMWVYTRVIKMIQDKIQPLIVPAILEDDSGLTSQVTVSGSKMRAMTTFSDNQGVVTLKPLEILIEELDSIANQLDHFEMDPQITQEIFKQLFYFICAGALNNLLLRKDLCHWAKGMQIRYNVSTLEEWCRKKKMSNQLVISLQPIIQASQLLQARKSELDVDSLCEMCNKLTMEQVVKLLNLYTPADEFEERLPISLIRQAQDKLVQVRKLASEEENSKPALLMDTKYFFEIEINFNPSNVRLDYIEIPDAFGLSGLVKRL